MLYCVAYFIIFVHYIAYAFLYVYIGAHVVIERLYPTMSFLHAFRSNIWCVYVSSFLNICIFLHICIVGGFHSHLHLSSFNINTSIPMKGECKTVPSLCKRGGEIYFCKINFKTKKCCFSDFCYNIIDLESLT